MYWCIVDITRIPNPTCKRLMSLLRKVERFCKSQDRNCREGAYIHTMLILQAIEILRDLFVKKDHGTRLHAPSGCVSVHVIVNKAHSFWIGKWWWNNILYWWNPTTETIHDIIVEFHNFSLGQWAWIVKYEIVVLRIDGRKGKVYGEWQQEQ